MDRHITFCSVNMEQLAPAEIANYTNAIPTAVYCTNRESYLCKRWGMNSVYEIHILFKQMAVKYTIGQWPFYLTTSTEKCFAECLRCPQEGDLEHSRNGRNASLKSEREKKENICWAIDVWHLGWALQNVLLEDGICFLSPVDIQCK